jgi:uncharacterized protein with PIN domain
MTFKVVCQKCGQVLYEGRDMIPIYRLRAKLDNRCPACNRKLSATPKNIELKPEYDLRPIRIKK